jgi:hypothetical protein
VHTYIENEVMYPGVCALLPDLKDDVLESYEEHHVADVLCMECDLRPNRHAVPRAQGRPRLRQYVCDAERRTERHRAVLPRHPEEDSTRAARAHELLRNITGTGQAGPAA